MVYNYQDFSNDRIVQMIKEYGSHHLSYLIDNPANFFFQASENETVCFRIHKKTIISIGGFFSANKEKTCKDFLDFCKSEKKTPVFFHFSNDELELFKTHSFKINQLGSSYAINVDEFAPVGKKFRTIRNKVNRANKNIDVLEIGKSTVDTADVVDQIKDIDNEWLKEKRKSELDFLIGRLEEIEDYPSSLRDLYLAKTKDDVVAYLQFTKTFGPFCGTSLDLSRRRNQIPYGTLELIISKVIDGLKEDPEKGKYLHFGFTPLTDLDYDVESHYSKTFHKILQLLYKYGSSIYPAQSQVKYKKNWYPTDIIPEYIATPKRFSIPVIMSFLKVTKSI